MQHRLAGHSEYGGGLVEADPAVGRGGHDFVADCVVDPDPPRRASGELFTGYEAVAQPSVDRRFADAEQAFGFSDGDHDGIIAVACDVFCWLVGGDAAGDPQRLHTAFGERQPGAGAAVLPGEDQRDGGVVVVRGQPPYQLDGVLVGGAEMPAGLGQRHLEVGAPAALPDDPQRGRSLCRIDGDNDLGHDRTRQLLAFPSWLLVNGNPVPVRRR